MKRLSENAPTPVARPAQHRCSYTSLTSAGMKKWGALAVLTLAVTLLAVDGTVLDLAIPSLSKALAPTATEVLWIGDIYSFMLAGLLVTMGNVADRIGRKKLLLLGAFAFGASSALAAFAPTAGTLIAARALLGISGATIMPSTLSLIRTIFAEGHERTRAIAIWSAGATGGAAVAPLIGGVLLEHFWWGAVFLINIPVMVLVVALGALILPESRSATRAPIDLFSAALSFMAIVPLVFAVKTIATAGFTRWALAGTLIGIVAGVVFVLRQRCLPHPLIDVALFTRPAFTGAVAANSIAIFALSGLLFFFSQYIQLVRGFTPLRAGLAELPLTIAAIGSVIIIGRLVTWLGQGRTIAAGLGITAAGLIGLALTEAQPGFTWLAISLAAIGVGVSVAETVATDAVVSTAPRERAAAASAISETGYELGVALGIGVLGSVLNTLYRTMLILPESLPAQLRPAVSDSLSAAARALGERHGEVLAAARTAFTHAMQATSIIAAVIVAIAALIAFAVIPSPTGVRETAGSAH